MGFFGKLRMTSFSLTTPLKIRIMLDYDKIFTMYAKVLSYFGAI